MLNTGMIRGMKGVAYATFAGLTIGERLERCIGSSKTFPSALRG